MLRGQEDQGDKYVLEGMGDDFFPPFKAEVTFSYIPEQDAFRALGCGAPELRTGQVPASGEDNLYV